MTKPNFLFIMADQMAAPALPFYGHPVVQTPHLDRLAGDGVVFDNAYCNSPLSAQHGKSGWRAQRAVAIGVVKYDAVLGQAG